MHSSNTNQSVLQDPMMNLRLHAYGRAVGYVPGLARL